MIKKLIMKTILLFVLFVLAFTSCINEYEYEVKEFDNVLIVQGLITNSDEPSKVVLTRTVNLNDPDAILYESDAAVEISDNKGNTETLKETSTGVFETSGLSIKGEIGNEYLLTIYTSDGSIYESDPVTLRPVPDIDSVYLEYKEIYSYEDSKTTKGVSISVTTGEWEEDANYYLKWDYEETWKVLPRWWVEDLSIPHIPCYNIALNSDINIANTALYTSSQINKKEILFIEKDSYKPFYGYSILVKQYSMNESVYQFWKMMEENIENEGFLYDKIPYNAISNIQCINDEKKRVFGYFDASGIVHKRAHFISPVFGIKFANEYDEKCSMASGRETGFEEYLKRRNIDPDHIFIVAIDDGWIFYTKQRWCVDCSVNSTTTEKPDYWIYD